MKEVIDYEQPSVDNDLGGGSGNSDKLNKNWTPLIIAIAVASGILSLLLIF